MEDIAIVVIVRGLVARHQVTRRRARRLARETVGIALAAAVPEREARALADVIVPAHRVVIARSAQWRQLTRREGVNGDYVVGRWDGGGGGGSGGC